MELITFSISSAVLATKSKLKKAFVFPVSVWRLKGQENIWTSLELPESSTTDRQATFQVSFIIVSEIINETKEYSV